MEYTVLINETVKKALLSTPHDSRNQVRKAFEYLESGLWEGGVRVKKLRGFPTKVVFEARMNRGDRILFTLGHTSAAAANQVLIYVWSIVPHDDISRSAKKMTPADAPFLHFQPIDREERTDLELASLGENYITQEPVDARAYAETGVQRWFVLDEQEWERVLLYSKDHFEMHLYLSNQQQHLLSLPPPLLISGTAGSGKTTLCVYYLLRPQQRKSSRVLVTYNKYLRDFCSRIYQGLLNRHPEINHIQPPLFYTFKELCIAILGEAASRFRPDKEIDAYSFQHLFRRSRFCQEHDPILVWEEIRSIIKGAKPQIRPGDFSGLLRNWPRNLMDESNVRKLREYLLGLSHLSIGRQANHVMENLLNTSLAGAAAALSSLLQTRSDRLEKALISISGLVSKHEAIFSSPLMTLTEYEQIGRKRAPLFASNRQEIYQVAEWYQSRLKEEQMWDEIDLTRAALRMLDQNSAAFPAFDFIACDEVQDLTDIQLSLLMRLTRNPNSLLFAGDTKQIVNPSGFRWEEARRLFHDRGLPVPEVQHLTTNFRSVGNIVMLSNVLLQLKTELLGIKSDEKLDEWKFQGPPPVVLENVEEEEIANFVRSGAGRAIIVREDRERDRLIDKLQTELVFTIRDAKGLEFHSVILWKVGIDPKSASLWQSILSHDTSGIHEAMIRHELSLMYVGITRAQRNLVIYDGPQASPIWSDLRLADLVFRTQSTDVLESAWQTASTREEWKQQGDYFLEREHYRAAAECYRNAEETVLMHRASASAAELKTDFTAAAQHWEQAGDLRKSAECYEKAEQHGEAARIWESLQVHDRAALCNIRKLEQEKRFSEAAELWEQRQEFGCAKDNWLKAQRYDRLAAILEFQEDWYHAAAAYGHAHIWKKAAELYEHGKSLELAAQAWEKDSNYERAARLWSESGNSQNCLRCLRTHGDPQLLARYWIQQKEWIAAYEELRKLEPSFALEFVNSLPPRIARTHGVQAIHFTLENEISKAAMKWEKVKEFSMAAQLFERIENWAAAGKNYFSAKDWQNALLSYARATRNARVSPPMFYRTLGKILSQNQPNGRQIAAEYAAFLYKHNFIRSAKDAYLYIGMRGKAAQCAWELGDQEFAILNWTLEPDAEMTTEYLLQHKLYRTGFQVVKEVLERHAREPRKEMIRAYEKLFSEWWDTERTAETANSLREFMIRWPFHFTMEFYLNVMEFAGDYDSIYRTFEYYVHTMKQNEYNRLRLDFLLQAGRREATDPAGAGVRHLILEDFENAKRCWSRVDVSEMNHYCLEAAGLQEKLLEFFDRSGRWFDSAILCENMGDIDRSVNYYLQGGKPLMGANILAGARHYEAAFRLYDAAGDQAMAAKMLEKLKRFDEAAARYESIGDRSSFLRCAAKVKPRARQIKLS